MSTRVLELALALCACSTFIACDAAAPPAASADAKQAEGAPAPEQAKAATPEQAAPQPSAVPEGGVSSMPEGQTPPWFSTEAFTHEKVIRQDGRSNKLPTGQFSRMILLELAAGTTPAQCIEQARAKLGETIGELPAASETPQGYLMLKGEYADYEYNVVCGTAKGAPTLFLSYVQ